MAKFTSRSEAKAGRCPLPAHRPTRSFGFTTRTSIASGPLAGEEPRQAAKNADEELKPSPMFGIQVSETLKLSELGYRYA